MHMKHQQPNVVDGIESESFFGMHNALLIKHCTPIPWQPVNAQHWIVTGHFEGEEEEDGGGYSRTSQLSLKLGQNDQLTLQSYF